MVRTRHDGFTITELVIGISVIFMLVSASIPAFMGIRDKAKEAEVKANLHTIQIAVERYGVDNGEYPPFLLGGNYPGWENWHAKWDVSRPDVNLPANAWVYDPLIRDGYLHSYPENPFLRPKGGDLVIKATSFIPNPGTGDGDPRFGPDGTIMGCGLDDPFFFEDAHPNLPYTRIETKRTLDRGKYDPTEYGFPNKDAGNGNMPGLYYNFGGRYNPKTGKNVITFWPGNFFYKAYSKVTPAREGWSFPYPNNISALGFSDVHDYILGAWGSRRNPGYDVIRLQEVTPDEKQEQIFWRMPPPWSGVDDYPCGYTGRIGQPLGLPAVFGGGDKDTGPFWPPDLDPERSGQMIYGAPDGIKDGIIITMASGYAGSNLRSD